MNQQGKTSSADSFGFEGMKHLDLLHILGLRPGVVLLEWQGDWTNSDQKGVKTDVVT